VSNGSKIIIGLKWVWKYYRCQMCEK